jgi:glycosyltransferase involved in cell wall biosynthesis
MNIKTSDEERRRLTRRGWHIADPHRVANTPRRYRRYMAGALAEFTAIKGVDVAWKTGWLSDRAAAFLALGRPVVTEDTGAGKYLPSESGFRFVHDADEAEAAIKQILREWPRLSRSARNCAVKVFDSAKNLKKILDL